MECKKLGLLLLVCVACLATALYAEADSPSLSDLSATIKKGSDFKPCKLWFKQQGVLESKLPNGIFHNSLREGESRTTYKLHEITLVVTTDNSDTIKQIRTYAGPNNCPIRPESINLKSNGSFELSFPSWQRHLPVQIPTADRQSGQSTMKSIPPKATQFEIAPETIAPQ